MTTDDLAAALVAIASRPASDLTPLSEGELDRVRAAGSAAAEQGLPAVELVDLYLATAARAWNPPPAAALGGQPVLDAIRAVVPALVEGHQNTGRRLIRQEETLRQEFVDDLLRGDADVASLVQRAEPFGLDLGAAHQVVLAAPRGQGRLGPFDEVALNRAVIGLHGSRDTLVSTRSGQLVALLPAGTPTADPDEPARLLHAALTRTTSRKRWRIAIGRPYPGAYGVARSYAEAHEALALAERLHPDADMVPSRDLLLYRVLGRDRAALADLVETVLTPLARARGGAVPLLETLETYFAAGAVSTETARRLHVSVRTVTYRLARIADLTGFDPAAPAERMTLHAAVVGARLLSWPPASRT